MEILQQCSASWRAEHNADIEDCDAEWLARRPSVDAPRGSTSTVAANESL
ncbi:hypothetical protein [Immundisolibacter sp.]